MEHVKFGERETPGKARAARRPSVALEACEPKYPPAASRIILRSCRAGPICEIGQLFKKHYVWAKKKMKALFLAPRGNFHGFSPSFVVVIKYRFYFSKIIREKLQYYRIGLRLGIKFA